MGWILILLLIVSCNVGNGIIDYKQHKFNEELQFKKEKLGIDTLKEVKMQQIECKNDK